MDHDGLYTIVRGLDHAFTPGPRWPRGSGG
jgi:hypothetical protein